MPNRIIKESVCTSDSVDSLSWFEEAFFYRLIVNVDDYGRLDARPQILKARLFPLKDITVKQIENALIKLSTVGMVLVYEYDRKPFLQLCAWSKHQTIRNQKSKYPSPEDENSRLQTIEINCMQENANVPVIQSNPNPNPIQIQNAHAREDASDDACVIDKKIHTKKTKVVYDDDKEVNDLIYDFIDHRKKLKKPMTEKAIALLVAKLGNLSKGDSELKVALLKEAIERGWQSVYPLKDQQQQSARSGTTQDMPAKTAIDKLREKGYLDDGKQQQPPT